MKLVLVGGFLGAGKTTLLWECARRLAERQIKVGLITNDQVPGLVDTALLERSGADVREVAGSCFCCNFNGFQEAVASLVASGAECVIAEPVGSCTDLSATILQPLKEHFPQYDVAPLSVLIDPARVHEVFQAEQPLLHPDAAYILRLQLEEADQIVLTKVDTLSPAEREVLLAYLTSEFPDRSITAIAAATGEGLDQWLDTTLASKRCGTRIVPVDYDRYANGEAVLGWLNAVAHVRWIADLEPAWESFLHDLLARLQQSLSDSASEIGHLKILLDFPAGRITGNLTGLGHAPDMLPTGMTNALSATLTVNARVQIAPEGIEAAFREALASAAHGRVAPRLSSFHCIQPGRPEPTYRYTAVV